MEQEVKINQIEKLNIYENNLDFLNKLVDIENVWFLDDIEIEPFKHFSCQFSSEYWYLKYYLLKDGKYLIEDNFNYLFNEKEINIINMRLTDILNFNLKCIDGTWYLEIFKKNETTNILIKKLKSLNYI